MTTKKKTDRIKRDTEIDTLLDDGEELLNNLLVSVDKRHQNGGIFENKDHHKMVLKAVEEDI